jgi:uncharacterized protein (DUF2147 family)
MKYFLFFTEFIALASFSTLQDTEADRLLGVWEPSNGKARVKIEKIGNKYYGKIVWLKEPNDPATNQPKVDSKNPDASMRTVPLKGYRMLKDFTYSGNSQWENGTIYDPENGSDYSCKMELIDNNTLEVRGFIGISLFGRTDVWKRQVLKAK